MKRYALFVILVLVAFLAAGCSEKKEPEKQEAKAAATVMKDDAKKVSAVSEASKIIAEKSGEKIYHKFCITCHGTGAAGAPKLGDKAAWEPRIKTGKDTLFQKAWNGLNAMPPKGLCMECTEQDIKDTIDYMLSQIK